MSTSSKPQVTVTGANGYIASVLVDELVKRGYRINATVRSIAKEAAFQKRFPTVKLFEADLITPGAFDAAFAGSEIIFHTASPVLMQSEDPENEIIKPAVQGLENAIRSAIATPTVRRIVFTSSTVTTVTVGKVDTITEKSWNADPPETAFPYSRSKTLAEQRAWAMIKEYETSEAFKTHPISLVTVLPALTVGAPIFAEKARSSAGFIATIFDGTAKAQGGLMNITSPCVDVRDIAKAHIDAAEKTTITGRLLSLHRKALSFKDMAQLVREKFPQLASNIPAEYLSPQPMFQDSPVDNSLTEKQLGWEFKDPVPALFELVEALIASGAVKLNA